MKSISSIFFATLFLIAACNSSENSVNKNIVSEDSITSRKDSIELSDSNLIRKGSMVKDEKHNHKIFISIIPSVQWIDSMQKLNGEDGWNEVVQDNVYYEELSKSFLISKGFKEIESPSERIWKLVGDRGIVKNINSDTLKDKWGLIIFDGIHDPIFYEGVQPEVDLKGI